MFRSPSFQRRREIWESNYGRDEGWFVELDGVCVAELVDCQFVDHFWDSYRIVPIANELDIHDELFQRSFWDNVDHLTYRNRKFGDTSRSAWPAATPLTNDGRVVMRGLYLEVKDPSWLDRWLIWWDKPTT